VHVHVAIETAEKYSLINHKYMYLWTISVEQFFIFQLHYPFFTLPTRQWMLKMYPVKNKNARNILLQSWIDVSIGATPVFCLAARRVTYDSYRPSQTGHLAQPKMACFKWEGLTTDTEAWQTFPALTTLISNIIVSCIVLRGTWWRLGWVDSFQP